MKIAITGATGFIGRHVRDVLARTTHEVVLVVRNPENEVRKSDKEILVFADLFEVRTDWFHFFGEPDAVMHLAWGGLPNYLDNYHVDFELPNQVRFIKALVNSGLKKLLVSGTCFEYGFVDGPVCESRATQPSTPYAVAKDMLRKELFQLQLESDFDLTWARIFYTYGEGQSEKSVFMQLKNSIEKNEKFFLMSSGKQVFDFIEVERVAELLCKLVTHSNKGGIINIGSGNPKTLLSFVLERISRFDSSIIPLTDSLPDRPWEPKTYWSNNSKAQLFLS
jgi:nucleoside-diphosphate-sugar epimerase